MFCFKFQVYGYLVENMQQKNSKKKILLFKDSGVGDKSSSEYLFRKLNHLSYIYILIVNQSFFGGQTLQVETEKHDGRFLCLG